MFKLISFALWGDNPKYTVGAVKNAKLAREFYPDWTCKFFLQEDVKDEIGSQLVREGAIVQRVPGPADWTFSLNRFRPFTYSWVSRFISRDCDSRFSAREAAAVKEWEDSGFLCHTMKDHPYHYSYPLLAGMTGFKNPALFDFEKELAKYRAASHYHHDQDFLRDVILPFYGHSVAFHGPPNFTVARDPDRFVGQALNENDEIDQEHLRILKNYERQ